MQNEDEYYGRNVHAALSYKKIVERRKFMRLPRSNILLREAEENGR